VALAGKIWRHPSRLHHLFKTFYCGPGGPGELRLPGGTTIFSSPTGRTYTTEPLGAQLFAQLNLPTGQRDLPRRPHRLYFDAVLRLFAIRVSESASLECAAATSV